MFRRKDIQITDTGARYPWIEGFDDIVSLSVMGKSLDEALDTLGIYPCNDEESFDSTGYCSLTSGAVASRNHFTINQAGKYIDGAYAAVNSSVEVQYV